MRGERIFGLSFLVSLFCLVLAPATGREANDHLIVHSDISDRAVALLERINSDLLFSSSATFALESWCARFDLARPAAIRVIADSSATHAVTPEQRERLRVGADEEVRYRNVKLKCGQYVLSEAENWYVPSRLTAEMNAKLIGTQTPYGKVILPLNPTRRTFAMVREWAPMREFPRRAEVTSEGIAAMCADTAFSHRALVIGGNGLPLAEVWENYKLELICHVLQD